MGVCFEPQSCFYRIVAKFKEKLSFSTYFFKKLTKNYEKQQCLTISDGSLQPKECCGRENLDCFWRKSQLLFSGSKTKGYKILVLAFFMSFFKIALKVWPDLLHAPWHGQNNATKKKQESGFFQNISSATVVYTNFFKKI